MSNVPMQTRFPRLWLMAQKLIGGTHDKASLILRHYSNQRRVLEVGCSVGNISDFFRDFEGIEYTGIDVDASAIDVARRRFSAHENFRFETMPVEELSRLGDKYDFVVIAGVLHHVDDRSAISIVEHSWTLTAAGGVLIASEPEALRENDSRIFRLFYQIEEGQFLRSKKNLIEVFDRAHVSLSKVEEHFVSPGIVKYPVARFNLLRSDRATSE